MSEIMSFFRTRYRIVRDGYNGYESQWRYWWMPFWVMCDGCNTDVSLEAAKTRCRHHAQPVVCDDPLGENTP